MKNYLLTISYNGSSFYGWNLQPHKQTIVGEITKAIKTFYPYEVKLQGSGRTDRGVHAYNQKATLLLKQHFSCQKLKQIINNSLHHDIKIKQVQFKPINFHARYHVKLKTYLYKIHLNPKNFVFTNNFYWFVDQQLNLALMRRAAQLFYGSHHFASFSSTAKKDQQSLSWDYKTITKITINKKNDVVLIKITGKGFLKHMVRKIVATLVAICQNKISLQIIEKAFQIQKSSFIQYKAPPQGLYLFQVKY